MRRVDCRRSGKVKREQLAFLADNPLYTKRFAYFVGQRCRQATIKDVAKELALDWQSRRWRCNTWKLSSRALARPVRR
mgnify:CR=1 FL=1